MFDLGIEHRYEIKKLYVKEINTYEQIKLLKYITFETETLCKIQAISNVLNKLIEGDCDYNILDLFALYIKIRIISIGDSVELKVILPNSKEATYNLNLFETYKALVEKIYSFRTRQLTKDNILIVCDIPSAKDYINICNLINEKRDIDSFIPFFIKDLYINNIDANFSAYNEHDRSKIYEELDIYFKFKVREYIIETINHFSDILLYKSIDNVDIYFNLLTPLLYSYIEFLFNSDLASLHETIYKIVNIGSIGYESVLGMCELERNLYISFINNQHRASDRGSYENTILDEEVLNDELND